MNMCFPALPPGADKQQCRRYYRALAAASLPKGEARVAAEAMICSGVARHLSRFSGVTVALFCAAGHEPDISALIPVLHARGHRLCLPCSMTADDVPVFRAYAPEDALRYVGTPAFTQPLASAVRVTPDVIICPLLAFDDTGTRLGQGGGYYDRAVALYKPRAFIGAAFEALRAKKLPPRETHDARLTGTVTEAGVFVEHRLRPG